MQMDPRDILPRIKWLRCIKVIMTWLSFFIQVYFETAPFLLSSISVNEFVLEIKKDGGESQGVNGGKKM